MARKREAHFRIEARMPTEAGAELAAAEAWEAGADGVEEREVESSSGSTLLVLYAKRSAAATVRDAVAAIEGAQVSEPEPVEDTDWSEAWREGLGAIRVGDRLVVRPSWVEAGEPQPEAVVVIDPGQAFGTGGHVSTRLVLDWLEELSRRNGALDDDSRVLDVGTGSGVLALSALALGAGRATGFDLDPESGKAARHWAEVNGLADRFQVLVGPIEAVEAGDFDWVLANLLKREVLPLARAIASRTRPGGRLVLSGLLAREEEAVVGAFESEGFVREGERHARDGNGDDWVSPLMRRS